MVARIPELIMNLPSCFETELARNYNQAEAKAIARLLVEELSGKQMVEVLVDSALAWTGEQIRQIEKILTALQNNEPIQYILGFADFMDLRFAVKPGVLIPRGETEELVVWIINNLKEKGAGQGKGLRILDIACGSGIIGICLARAYPEAEIVCTDLYPVPLELTKENARLNGFDVEVFQMDALNPSSEWQDYKFDIIVSNPPYVTEYQKKRMASNVLEHEPESALFVNDDDPMIFYREISKYASKVLTESGDIFFEINEDLGNETKSLLYTYFQFVELKKDIHQKNRMIRANNGSK